MGLFSDFTRLIQSAVGDNRDNNPEDVLAVKKRLGNIGLIDMTRAPEPHGYITADTDTAIRRFQGVKGLKVDGYLMPGGETERALNGKSETPHEHYIKGAGEAMPFTAEEMDATPTFAQAMQTNKKRFEESLTKDKVDDKIPHEFKNRILTLRDGESTILSRKNLPGGSDYWDRDIQTYEGAKSGDVMQSLRSGAVKLRSTGSLRAARKGNTIEIDGVVDHKIGDAYDFNLEDKEFS